MSANECASSQNARPDIFCGGVTRIECEVFVRNGWSVAKACRQTQSVRGQRMGQTKCLIFSGAFLKWRAMFEA